MGRAILWYFIFHFVSTRDLADHSLSKNFSRGRFLLHNSLVLLWDILGHNLGEFGADLWSFYRIWGYFGVILG